LVEKSILQVYDDNIDNDEIEEDITFDDKNTSKSEP